MDQKSLYKLLALGALVLGAIAFMAIPPKSTTTHIPGPGAGFRFPGVPAGNITNTCGTFEYRYSCGPRFWLRAGAFSAGAFGAVVLLFLASPPTSGKARSPFTAPPTRTADSPSNQPYACDEAGCGFRTFSLEASRKHGVETGHADSLAEASNDHGFGSPAPERANGDAETPTSSRSPGVPDLKTCPDCAEQVRFAARKCRFCGYAFDPSGASV